MDEIFGAAAGRNRLPCGSGTWVLQVPGEDARMPVEQGRPLIPSQVGTHDWRQPFQGWKEQRQDMTTSEVPTTRSLGSSLSPGPLQGRYLCRARAYPSTSCIQLPSIPLPAANGTLPR